MKGDRLAFLDGFTSGFFAAGDKTDLISEPQRLYARDIAAFASPKGTLDCIAAFGRTDFRGDLEKIDVPTLVYPRRRGRDRPARGQRPALGQAIADATLHVVEGGPHGLNATHADEFNRVLLEFLAS